MWVWCTSHKHHFEGLMKALSSLIMRWSQSKTSAQKARGDIHSIKDFQVKVSGIYDINLKTCRTHVNKWQKYTLRTHKKSVDKIRFCPPVTPLTHSLPLVNQYKSNQRKQTNSWILSQSIYFPTRAAVICSFFFFIKNVCSLVKG